MKKIVGLLALVGAVAAAVSVIARRRGQDLGQFADEWTERAREAAANVSSTMAGAASSAEEQTLDLRDDLAEAVDSDFLDDVVEEEADDLPATDRS